MDVMGICSGQPKYRHILRDPNKDLPMREERSVSLKTNLQVCMHTFSSYMCTCSRSEAHHFKHHKATHTLHEEYERVHRHFPHGVPSGSQIRETLPTYVEQQVRADDDPRWLPRLGEASHNTDVNDIVPHSMPHIDADVPQ